MIKRPLVMHKPQPHWRRPGCNFGPL